MSIPLSKRPAVWVPPVLSLVALLLIGSHLAIVGNIVQEDEGTAARLFQLVMAAQIPVIGYGAVSGLAHGRRRTLVVLALQLAAAIVPVALVILLERTAQR